jgi:hypothetical protein
MKKTSFFLHLCVVTLLFLLVSPVFAEESEIVLPTKEGLIAAWEEKLQNRPDTVIFSNADDEGVYEFKTTLFPYEGRLKILNIVIEDRDTSYYGYEYDDYRDDDDSGFVGAIETELLDIEDWEEFSQKYHYSSAAWRNFNLLFFPNDAQRWMSKGEWNSYIEEKNSLRLEQEVSEMDDAKSWFVGEIIMTWVPLLVLLGFIFWIFRYAVEQRKKYDGSLERQEFSIERQQEGLNFAKESLEIQKEQLSLLKEIIDKPKR